MEHTGKRKADNVTTLVKLHVILLTDFDLSLICNTQRSRCLFAI